jgi:hypothetical protein
MSALTGELGRMAAVVRVVVRNRPMMFNQGTMAFYVVMMYLTFHNDAGDAVLAAGIMAACGAFAGGMLGGFIAGLGAGPMQRLMPGHRRATRHLVLLTLGSGWLVGSLIGSVMGPAALAIPVAALIVCMQAQSAAGRHWLGAIGLLALMAAHQPLFDAVQDPGIAAAVTIAALITAVLADPARANQDAPVTGVVGKTPQSWNAEPPASMQRPSRVGTSAWANCRHLAIQPWSPWRMTLVSVCLVAAGACLGAGFDAVFGTAPTNTTAAAGVVGVACLLITSIAPLHLAINALRIHTQAVLLPGGARTVVVRRLVDATAISGVELWLSVVLGVSAVWAGLVLLGAIGVSPELVGERTTALEESFPWWPLPLSRPWASVAVLIGLTTVVCAGAPAALIWWCGAHLRRHWVATLVASVLWTAVIAIVGLVALPLTQYRPWISGVVILAAMIGAWCCIAGARRRLATRDA